MALDGLMINLVMHTDEHALFQHAWTQMVDWLLAGAHRAIAAISKAPAFSDQDRLCNILCRTMMLDAASGMIPSPGDDRNGAIRLSTARVFWTRSPP